MIWSLLDNRYAVCCNNRACHRCAEQEVPPRFSSGNHWHSLITIRGCQAGKDVYVQKPCSHNVFEGRKCVEAALGLWAHRSRLQD